MAVCWCSHTSKSWSPKTTPSIFALGLEADIYAAGLKSKQSEGKVVFGSVQSVARNLDHFQGEFSLLIVDECHRISDDDESQYQQILQHLRKVNPRVRLLGLTATPFRLGKGWIYRFHYHGICAWQ